MIDTLIVFGATGDLCGRLLLPAVAALQASGALSPGFRFVGVGQEKWSVEQFVDHARAKLAAHAPRIAAADRERLLAAVTYRPADVCDPVEVAAVLDAVRAEVGAGQVAIYLALPTQLMFAAARGIQAHGLAAGSRVAIEKPLGYDDRSAAELNAVLAEIAATAGQAAIYRVDHVLAMTAVQNLPVATDPRTKEQLGWDSRQIAQVEVLFEETLALEGRASFYDRAGALRDVMQNHQLEMLATMAQAAGGGSPADRRAEVLRAVRPLSAQDVRTRTRRARYSAGRLATTGGADGRLVPDYQAESGVDPTRDTETFAEVTLEIGTPQWLGTTFVLRAGKAMSARRRGVLVHFRAAPSTGVTDEPVWLDIDETSASAGLDAEPEAYERIAAELLNGGSDFAVSAAEAELAWEIVMPVLRAWSADDVPMLTYPAGSIGP